MKNNSYESNLKMILRAIQGRGIETAEAMLKEEQYQNNRRKRTNKQHKRRKRERNRKRNSEIIYNPSRSHSFGILTAEGMTWDHINKFPSDIEK